MMLQSSLKSTMVMNKTKRGHRDKHTDSQNKERPAHSKFKFQIQIARKTRKVVSGAPHSRFYICKLISVCGYWRGAPVPCR